MRILCHILTIRTYIELYRNLRFFLCILNHTILCFRFNFKGIIDYIFYTRQTMTPLGLLGPLAPEWFKDNKVLGCPHPHIPSGKIF